MCSYIQIMLYLLRIITFFVTYVRLCVCVCPSIHREGFICSDQLDCQGSDQRCYVEGDFFPMPSPFIATLE